MASEEHSRFREDLAAYALGALDAEEAAALEAHLHTCETCQAELADYRTIGDNLLASLPPRQPPPALREQLQSRLPPAQKPARRRFVWSFGQLALGTMLVLLFAMNLSSFMQMRQLQSQQVQLTRQLQNSQVALAMLSYPGTQSLPIREGEVSGSVLLDRERNAAALVAWNLPELTPEQIYQIWLIEPDGQRVSAGLFRPQADSPYTTQPIFSGRELSSFVGIGVTVEPAPGSEQPTGPRVFKVDF
jgi:anti-sigma-K factor RskA